MKNIVNQPEANDMLNKQLTLAKQLNELYVLFYCDFLTVECFAKYKGWRLDFARQVINAGRKINHNQDLLNLIYKGI